MLSAMMASWSVDNETSPKRIQEKFFLTDIIWQTRYLSWGLAGNQT